MNVSGGSTAVYTGFEVGGAAGAAFFAGGTIGCVSFACASMLYVMLTFAAGAGSGSAGAESRAGAACGASCGVTGRMTAA